MWHFKKTTTLLIATILLFAGKNMLDTSVLSKEAGTMKGWPAVMQQSKEEKTCEGATIRLEPETATRIYDIPLSRKLQNYTFYLCKENGLDYEMLLAIMDQESDYRERVISKTNDYGIMQINKTNHGWLEKELGITDFLDPEQNIRAGVRMIAGLTGKYQDPHQVLMAYNLGDAGAKRLWDQGKTTSEYSRSIMAKAEYLRKELRTEWQPAENASDH